MASCLDAPEHGLIGALAKLVIALPCGDIDPLIAILVVELPGDLDDVGTTV